ncbi:MAG: hypothetical protein U0L18_05340 [Acutalibacteraceae bacterium]|nr:hypothetical protein [Acutalibacteraceae bacterium]
MEELIKVIVDNGLGIGSFIALLYFIFTYVKSLNETMTKISNTMVEIQINMATMTDRIDKIEEKINKGE